MPEYSISACLGDVSCELSYYTLVKLDKIERNLQNVDLLAQNIFIGLIAVVAVAIGWKFLKTVFGI